MTHRRTDNPFGSGEFWVEFDDGGEPTRGIWNNGSYSDMKSLRLSPAQLEAAAAICDLLGWQDEAARFEAAYGRIK